MVSLKDIASECGVSIATVSKALNGRSDIGEETRKRVAAAADAMGYVPNAAAKSLKTARTYNIGVLFVDKANSGLTHDFFSRVLDAFKREVERFGYDITFISANKERPGRTTYLEHARFRRFDGVCVACVDFTDPEVLELVQSEIPVITIDHMFEHASAVLSDNVGGMKDLATYVFSQGHRRVAYIHGEKSSVTANRLASFYRVAQKFGVEVPDAYIKEAAYRNTREAYERTAELLDLPEPPSCILYPDDFSALGGIRAIGERGLSIPDDVSVAGYDGLRLGRHLNPRLTTLWQDTDRIGLTAAEQLVRMIKNPKTTMMEQYMITGHLYPGESVKNLADGKQQDIDFAQADLYNQVNQAKYAKGGNAK